MSHMSVDSESLRGFARVFYEGLDPVDRETLEVLFRNIPRGPKSCARRSWQMAVITVFAEASKDVIQNLVKEYQHLDDGDIQ